LTEFALSAKICFFSNAVIELECSCLSAKLWLFWRPFYALSDTLISAKGSSQVPKDEIGQKLLDAVAGVQRLLPGWSVRGVIACHTPNNKLVRLKAQTDFKVWGHEDLERIGLADSREAIVSLF